MEEHSKIGASGMHRWGACPGSVRLSKGLDSSSSVYAAEGTVAHEIAAEVIFNEDIDPYQYVGETWPQDGHQIPVTKEMIDAVMVYVKYGRQRAKEADEWPEVWVEKKMHLKDIDEDAFGTADLVLYFASAQHLLVLDYKHGSGVPVEVEENPQLGYYATGAAWDLGAKTIEMGIVQPRCYHEDGPIRTRVITGVELLEWSMLLEDAIKATKDPDAPLHAGEYCRWCPAAGICPELERLVMETAMKDFKNEDGQYDPAHLADQLEKIPMIKAWCAKVDEFAYGEAMHGRCPPRFKLVEKRPQRKFSDPTEAKEVILMSFDVDEAEIMTEPQLKSPAQVEKVVGKKDFKAIEPMVKKESSGYVLVTEDDKRPPVNLGAEADFKPVGGE